MILAIILKLVAFVIAFIVAEKLLKGFKIEGGLGATVAVAFGYGVLLVTLGSLLVAFTGILTLGLGFLFLTLTWIFVGSIILILTDKLSSKLSIASFGTAFIVSLLTSLSATAVEYLAGHFLG